MSAINKKRNLKIFVFLLQAIVMFFLFLLLVDKQTVMLIKGIIEELNIDSNIQTLLAKLFLGFRMTFDIPSIFAFFLVFLQLICAKWVIQNYILMFFFDNKSDCESIEEKKYPVVSYPVVKNNSYLINLRLLN